jgi:hypothetical protein
MRRFVARCFVVGLLAGCVAAVLSPVAASAADQPAALSGSLDGFKDPTDGWSICGEVKLDPNNPKKLLNEPGQGILFSGGQGKDLATKETYADCEVELEFMIPKGSNAGVKLCGCYEIQVLDSWKKANLSGSDCGGIYPRAELKPRYHTIDGGVPPKVNACREPGQWQTLKIVFRGPRFDAAGEKTANAKFDRVELNGQMVQESQEAATPTGHAWHNKEKPRGPVLFQGDHGPVAIRKLHVKGL